MPMEQIIKENKLDLNLEDNVWEIPTRIELVNTLDIAMERKLTRAGWKLSEVRDFIKFVFHELLINAIAHGNLGIPGGTEHIYEVALKKQAELKTDKQITIIINTDNKDEISITIQDEGEGFDFRKVPDPTEAENLKKPTGRGEFMMKTYADSVTYRDEGREVEITLKRKDVLQ